MCIELCIQLCAVMCLCCSYAESHKTSHERQFQQVEEESKKTSRRPKKTSVLCVLNHTIPHLSVCLAALLSTFALVMQDAQTYHVFLDVP